MLPVCLFSIVAATPDWADPFAGDGGSAWVCPVTAGWTRRREQRMSYRDGAHIGTARLW